MMARRPNKLKPNRRGNEGVALILALVIVVLLTVIIVEFCYDAQVDASLALNQADAFEAYLAAKSAVAKGIYMLAQDSLAALLPQAPAQGGSSRNPNQPQTLGAGGPYDGLLETWSSEGIPVTQLNAANMRGSITDEYGKINLNALFDAQNRLQNPDGEPVPNELIMRALVHFFQLFDPESEAQPEELVAAIMDWIDAGDDYNNYTGAEGAESDFYEGAEIPYPCKNGPMDSIEELLLIRGFTKEMYFGDPEKDQLPLTEYLTVHGDPYGRINVNTAPPYLIQAIALAAQDVPQYNDLAILPDDIIQFRMASEGFYQTSDLMSGYVNYNPPQQDQNTPPGGPGEPGNVQAQQLVDSLFRVSSDCFRIRGDAVANATKVRIEAYVYRNPAFLGGAPPPQFAPGNQPPAEVAPPEEAFRVVEWKVFR